MADDLNLKVFVKALVESDRRFASPTNEGSELEKAQKAIMGIDARINRLSNLLAETTATATLLHKIEFMEHGTFRYSASHENCKNCYMASISTARD